MKMIIWFLSVAFFLAHPCFSQETGQDTLLRPSSDVRFEFPDNEYIHVPSTEQQTSPAYRFSAPGIFTVQVNVNESGENILGDAANEPSIAVDPTDPARMAIGWRQFDTIHSNFRQAGWGYTTDSGQTWAFPDVIEPGIFRSDPVLDYDAEGNFYFNSLTDGWICHVFKSTNGGATWDAGTFAQGGDKQWMAIDRTTGIGRGNIYAYWNGHYSICSPGNFTRSTDGGLSYEDCSVIEQEPYWGVLTVGNDGELYVCGASEGNFIVLKSTNAQDAGQTVTWDLSTPVSLGGEIWFGEGPNPGGLLGQAWIAVDHSSGPTRGNVYLLCSVNPPAPNDSLEVMFSSSTDGGATWSAPVRVNDDTGSDAWQWFGTMSVAPDGRIDAVWLDTRDDAGYGSSLYYAYSRDAGVTWSENTRLSESFDPHVGWPQQEKMGDYFHMISDATGAHLAWAATFNGEQDVYYSRVSVPSEACRITATSPDGGETWCVGESETITWTSENTSGTVKIAYSTDGGSSWQTVVAGTPDDGTYSWTVPDTPTASGLVRICDSFDPLCCDQSKSTFQVCKCWTIIITTERLPDGTEGCPYNETIDATGGCLPYSWSIISGALPDSLDLDNSFGVISGKPNEVGTFEFTVLVEDVLGDTDEKEISIQIGEYSNSKGDVNADCAFNVVDVVFVVNIILELVEPTQDQIWRADCNGLPSNCHGDGTINILDVIKIVNMILGLDDCPQ